MLTVHISTSSLNISDFKSNIIDPLIKAFNDIGIKVNLSRGDESHRNSIESLHQSDLILFFIAPYNEKQIQNCLIDKCSVISCPLKFNEQNVSNLYCELQLSSNIDKPLIIFNFNIFPKTKNNEYQLTLDIIDEIKKSDLNFGIFQYNDFNNSNLEKIKFQIAEKICEWHKEDQIKFKNFCGRKDKLHQIISNMEQSIEVYGVGGIGKTALIQVALLIEKFKGKKIISVGPKQVYISHSGYEIFRRKCFDAFHITDKYRITLDDIIDALSSYIPDISSLRKDTIERKYNQITNSITRENLILFIDDFHLADIDTQNLIKYTDHIIFSSRKKTGLANKEIRLEGIEKDYRLEYIELLCTEFEINISSEIKNQIYNITEGHPVSTELIVKNYEKINFNSFTKFDSLIIRKVDSVKFEDFLNRLVKEILTPDAFLLINNLSILNTDLLSNINLDLIKEITEFDNIDDLIYELIEANMIRKKENKQDIYQFYFQHIKEALYQENNTLNHSFAINYYLNKINKNLNDINDKVELFNHKIKKDFKKEYVKEFVELFQSLEPKDYGFRRLLHIGVKLEVFIDGDIKSLILEILGRINHALYRFEKAEEYFLKSLEIISELESRDTESYLPNYCDILLTLGEFYNTFGDYDSAIRVLRKAHKKYRLLIEKSSNDNSILNFALTLGYLAYSYINLEDYKKSEKNLLKSFEIIKKVVDKESNRYYNTEAWLLVYTGIYYRKLKNYALAKEYFIKSAKIYDDLVLKDPDLYNVFKGWLRDKLGLVHKDLKEYEEAEKYYMEAINLKEELREKNPKKFRHRLAFCYNEVGNFYRKIKNYQKAEDFYQKAFNIWNEYINSQESIFFLPKLVLNLNNFGYLYLETSQLKKSKDSFNKAIEISKNQKHHPSHNTDLIISYRGLGHVYSKLKDYNKSLEFYEKALEITKQKYIIRPEIYSSHLINIYLKLAKIHELSDNIIESTNFYILALQVQKDSIEIDKKTYLPKVLKTLNKIARIYRNQKRYFDEYNILLETLNYYEQVNEKTVGFIINEAKTKRKLGQACQGIKNYSQAEIFFLGSINTLSAVPFRAQNEKYDQLEIQVVISLLSLGDFYFSRKFYWDAENIYNEGILRCKNLENMKLKLKFLIKFQKKIAEVYIYFEQYELARPLYEKLIEEYKFIEEQENTENIIDLAYSYRRLGNIFIELGEFNEAIQTYAISKTCFEDYSILKKRDYSRQINIIGQVIESLTNGRPIDFIKEKTFSNQNQIKSEFKPPVNFNLSIKRFLNYINKQEYKKLLISTTNVMQQINQSIRTILPEVYTPPLGSIFTALEMLLNNYHSQFYKSTYRKELNGYISDLWAKRLISGELRDQLEINTRRRNEVSHGRMIVDFDYFNLNYSMVIDSIKRICYEYFQVPAILEVIERMKKIPFIINNKDIPLKNNNDILKLWLFKKPNQMKVYESDETLKSTTEFNFFFEFFKNTKHEKKERRKYFMIESMVFRNEEEYEIKTIKII